MISDDAPVNRFKPSVDYLFHRLAKIKDLSFVAGILTGMGKEWLVAVPDAWVKPQGFVYPIPVPLKLEKTL